MMIYFLPPSCPVPFMVVTVQESLFSKGRKILIGIRSLNVHPSTFHLVMLGIAYHIINQTPSIMAPTFFFRCKKQPTPSLFSKNLYACVISLMVLAHLFSFVKMDLTLLMHGLMLNSFLSLTDPLVATQQELEEPLSSFMPPLAFLNPSSWP
jgi:hypothetical protein